MEKFDYLSIQSIANHIVTVSNGKINTAKKLFEGASYRVHNENSNIFYSSNNFLRNNLFESAFKKNELFGIYETLVKILIEKQHQLTFPKTFLAD